MEIVLARCRNVKIFSSGMFHAFVQCFVAIKARSLERLDVKSTWELVIPRRYIYELFHNKLFTFLRIVLCLRIFLDPAECQREHQASRFSSRRLRRRTAERLCRLLKAPSINHDLWVYIVVVVLLFSVSSFDTRAERFWDFSVGDSTNKTRLN